jgi:hypothetical protein
MDTWTLIGLLAVALVILGLVAATAHAKRADELLEEEAHHDRH